MKESSEILYAVVAALVGVAMIVGGIVCIFCGIVGGNAGAPIAGAILIVAPLFFGASRGKPGGN